MSIFSVITLDKCIVPTNCLTNSCLLGDPLAKTTLFVFKKSKTGSNILKAFSNCTIFLQKHITQNAHVLF